MKKIILLFFCGLPAITLADVSFNEMFDLDLTENIALADRVATYQSSDIALDLAAQKTELENLQQQIEAMIRAQPNDPILQFINGMNHNNLAAVFAAQERTEATKVQIDERNLAYQKAMLLDRTPPLRLSAAVYAAMKYGLPEAEKIKAIESEIKGGGSGDSDDQFIQLHWSRVNALEKSGRHAEAQKALTEMQREINKRELKNPDYQRIVDRVQKEIDQGRAADTTTQASTSAKSDNQNSTADQPVTLNKNTLWIIFFGALTLVSIWMVVRALRSK